MILIRKRPSEFERSTNTRPSPATGRDRLVVDAASGGFDFDLAPRAADTDDETDEHVDQADHHQQEEGRRARLTHQQKFRCV